MKRCSTCKEDKPLSEFYRDARAKDGHTYQCKACNTDRQRAVRHTGEDQTLSEWVRRCVVCASRIEGRGMCARCEAAVEALGGLEGLKRAVRWLQR